MPAPARPKGATKGGAPPLDRSVIFRLIRLVNLAARPFVERIGKPNSLTLPEWRVMVVLATRPGSTGAEIAFESGLDKMAVSRAIAALERAGRARRFRDPGDRRMGRVALSGAGLSVYRAIAVLAREREAMLLGGLSEDQKAALEAAVDRMTGRIVAADFAENGRPRSTTVRRR